MALIMKNDGTKERRHCIPFNYTKQTIITDAYWQRHVQCEISCVKTLAGGKHRNKGPWIKFAQEGIIYEEGDVNKLNNLGKKTRDTSRDQYYQDQAIEMLA